MRSTTRSTRRRRTMGPIGAAGERRLARGFSLIEMVMVLGVISIVLAFAYPRMNVTEWRQDTAARLVRTTLQKAQRMAVTRQFNVVVSFDTTRGTMRVLEDANNDGTAEGTETRYWYPLDAGARFATPPAGVSGSVAGALAGSDVQTVDGMPSVIFRRDGSANTDLEVYVGSVRGVGDDFRAVVVVNSTGRADWMKYLGGHWRPMGA